MDLISVMALKAKNGGGGGVSGTPSRDVTWAQYQELTEEQKMSDTDWYITDKEVPIPSDGGGIKAKIVEHAINSNGILVESSWQPSDPNIYYFTSDIGYPICAIPYCDGDGSKYQGNLRIQMQSYTKDSEGNARWFFYALKSSSEMGLITSNTLTQSAVKMIIFYVENVEEG